MNLRDKRRKLLSKLIKDLGQSATIKNDWALMEKALTALEKLDKKEHGKN